MKNAAFLFFFLFSISGTFGASIAYFYALDADLQSLVDLGGHSETISHPGSPAITKTSIGNYEVFATKMGVGCVETAITAQALLSTVRCSLAISVGPVGALASNLEIGQWGRVEKVIGYQRGTYQSEGFVLAEGSTLTLPNIPAFEKSAIFQEDGGLFTVASGEIFCSSASFRTHIKSTFGANTIDMNLWGLVQVCKKYQLPLAAWRIVSDHAKENASEEFSNFHQTYQGTGGAKIAALIRSLPPDPTSVGSYLNLKSLLK